LFDQGKIEGLSSDNINYIKDTFIHVSKLLDVAEGIVENFI
jgi:hypothetical protein